MDALRKCWISLQEAQLQENPWQGSLIYLWMIFFGTDGKEMEQRVLTRLRKDFHVGSEDWNDVTFTRQRIRWAEDPQTGSHIEVSQEKAIEELRRSQWNATRKKLPLYPCNAYRIHKLSGTNKLVAEQDTVPMLSQVFQLCFNDSLSNNWRCEGSQQAGEAAQVTASETSVLATFRTIENTWIS